MKRELAGKRALVTGASRGIGLAIARRLAADGARMAMNTSHSRVVMLTRPEAWREVLHVEGAFRCARAALRAMIARRSDRIVNVVSPAALFGKPGAASDAAAKGALVA